MPSLLTLGDVNSHVPIPDTIINNLQQVSSHTFQLVLNKIRVRYLGSQTEIYVVNSQGFGVAAAQLYLLYLKDIPTKPNVSMISYLYQ